MNANERNTLVPKFNLGDLVTVSTHPFTQNNADITLKARAEYTSPIFSIFEIKNSNLYNEETGLKDIQYHCVFFNSKTGLFERKWFKEQQLKLIKSYESLSDKVKESVYLEDVQNVVNAKVILQTVDIELGKTKSIFEKRLTNTNKLTAHLDFLPPIMLVLDVVKIENKKVFNPKTGVKNNSSILFKVKWYNHIKQCFSEDLLNPIVLRDVTSLNDESLLTSFKKDKYYVIPDSKIELGNSKFPNVIIADDICYNSYFYELSGRSIYNNDFLCKKILSDSSQVLKEIELENIFSEEKLGFVSEGVFKKLTPRSFTKGKVYKIVYKNKMGKISERVIYVNRIIILNSSLDQLNENAMSSKMDELDSTYQYFIEANCLMRNNELRHFRISSESVFSIKELIHGIETDNS